MSYVDLGTISTKSEKRGGSKIGVRVPGKLLLLGVLLVFLILGFRLLISSSPTVLAQFWSTSGQVISFMIPGRSHLLEDEGVTNVLLVGIDKRSEVPYSYTTASGQVVKNGFLADTIIIASLNRKTSSVSMLSIPRDLWVKMPAFGNLSPQYSKINAAHALGDQFGGQENGGMLLLKEVVEQILDIPIHYWVRIDFAGFEKGIDAIEGIDVVVERTFDDYMFPRPGYENAPWNQRWEHVHFDAGLQHMDGATALEYARSRHALGVEGSDFARSRRQQKVIIAAKNKILSSSTLFNTAKLKELYEVVSDHVRTNVKLSEFPLFFSLAKQFSDKEVKTYSLTDETENLLAAPTDLSLYGGAWVLVPAAGGEDFSDVQGFVKGIFYERE